MKGFIVGVMGLIREVVPSTSKIFAVILPNASPITIPGCFDKAALIPNASSGNVVPIETMNKPIRTGGADKSVAIKFACLTTKCEDKISKNIPIKNLIEF